MSEKNKPDLQYKKLVDSVYDRDIYFILSSQELASKFVASRFETPPFPEDDSDGESVETEEGKFLIWIEPYDDSPEWYAVLTHEVMHTTFEILKSIGISLRDESEEAYTYYADSLIRQAIKFARKKKI